MLMICFCPPILHDFRWIGPIHVTPHTDARENEPITSASDSVSVSQFPTLNRCGLLCRVSDVDAFGIPDVLDSWLWGEMNGVPLVLGMLEDLQYLAFELFSHSHHSAKGDQCLHCD